MLTLTLTLLSSVLHLVLGLVKHEQSVLDLVPSQICVRVNVQLPLESFANGPWCPRSEFAFQCGYRPMWLIRREFFLRDAIESDRTEISKARAMETEYSADASEMRAGTAALCPKRSCRPIALLIVCGDPRSCVLRL